MLKICKKNFPNFERFQLKNVQNAWSKITKNVKKSKEIKNRKKIKTKLKISKQISTKKKLLKISKQKLQ